MITHPVFPASKINPSSRTTTIGIVGAGIAGLATYISLCRLPGVSVHVFEQAAELREVGASIALGPNGLRGLEEIGVPEALSDDVGFRSDHGIPHVFQHWKTGEILANQKHSSGVTERRHNTSRFFRPHLINVLAHHVPPEHLHLGERLVGIEFESSGRPVLKFEDGQVFPADLVIGADGIKSRVRGTYILNFKLQHTGQIWLRAVFPISRLSGLDLPQIQNTIHTVGPDRTFFSSALANDLFTVVTSKYEDLESPIWRDKQWDQEAELDRFRSYFEKDWNPTIRALASRTENLRVYPSISADEIPNATWRNRIVLVGDAFHPFGGAFAAGGSMAIDDAVALYLALSHTQGDLPKALELYEATRRPHVLRVMESVKASRKNGGKWMDEEKIREFARTRQDGYGAWLHEHDVHEAFRVALVERSK
ncbi:FAD/NAD(P)-binding domain-containing protein [Marasmius fiardii PR-910]|nr:FAD/NAD(P)-binding domain-containing protein [Marasmius fiardii PR-910]